MNCDLGNKDRELAGEVSFRKHETDLRQPQVCRSMGPTLVGNLRTCTVEVWRAAWEFAEHPEKQFLGLRG
jgi:hypothetical protein